MSEVERRSWERARDRTLQQLRENKEPKLAPRLRQELAIIEALLSQSSRSLVKAARGRES